MQNLELGKSLNTKGNNEVGKNTALNYSHPKHHCTEISIFGRQILKKKSFNSSKSQYMIKNEILNYNSDVYFSLGCKHL